jgi:multidrug efflux pump subunit AcrB
MDRLLRYFVSRHLIVNVMVGLIFTAGVLAATRASRETFPSVSIPTLFVNANLPGASARDVETKVTIPLEEAIEELSGVKTFSTVITDSNSFTEIELYDDFQRERIIEAQADLAVLIDGINDFPPEMEDEPTIQRLNPRKFPVVQVAMSGPSQAVIPVAKRLEKRLEAHDLVAKVDLVGLQDPEVRVLVDPVLARQHGVTLLDVVSVIRNRNVSSTGGVLETESARRQVVMWSRFEKPEEVGATILRFGAEGSALRVRDVARVEVGREDTGIISHTNGKPGISAVVTKREDADIIDTVAAVHEIVSQISWPEHVEAVIVRDDAFLTRNRLELMLSNGLLGACLVAIILFLFLTRVASFWVLVGIPVVFLGTLALFPILDYSINIVTLTGFVVVLGMVVDDAVIVAERIVTLRQAGVPPLDAASQGASEMSRPVAASAFTTMLAFLPLWALGGMSGRMTEAMPAVVILALGLSVFESCFILPAHMSLGKQGAETEKRKFVIVLEERYRKLLLACLRHRPIVVTAFFAGLVSIFVFVAPQLGIQLFSQDDSEALYIKVNTPLGTPIERTEAVVAAIERQIPDLVGEDLLAVIARVGHQRTRDERERGAAENEAVVRILFRNTDRLLTSAEWTDVLQEHLVVPGEAELLFEAEIMGPPLGHPVTVHVSGNVNSTRRAAAQEVVDWLHSADGVINVEMDERPGTPQIELNLDYEKLALRGLDAADVGQTIKAAFFGLTASEHRDLDDTTDIRVLFDSSARRSLDGLLETPVRARDGGLVLLRDVVNPVEIRSVQRIYHRDGIRCTTIRAQFGAGSPHTSLSMAQRIESHLLPRFEDVDGLDVIVGGEAVETRKTTSDVGIAALLSFLGIGVVIAVMLGSFVEAAFVIIVIPFAIAGVMLTFFLHQQALSLFAMMGSIGLAGVVVNASIVMVDAVHRRMDRLSNATAEERRIAVIDAVVSRLRPILVTTLTTLGGVLPMAYGLGGYDSIVAPMSLALGWGLAFSTIVTLFLVPILYTISSDLRDLSFADVLDRLRSFGASAGARAGVGAGVGVGVGAEEGAEAGVRAERAADQS